MNFKTINLSSLQFGLSLNDAFGLVVILQTMCVLVDTIFGIVYWTPPSQGVAWFIVICLMITVEPIIFCGFFCWGFIWKGDAWTLRLWIILAAILDLMYMILMLVGGNDETSESGNGSGSGDSGSSSWASGVAIILTPVVFRGYIYLVSWLVWRELNEGGEVKGYGQGLVHLGQYYKGEFCRIATILLFVEVMWNLGGTLVFDFLHGIELHSQSAEKDGSLIFRPIFLLRIGRVALALIGIYFLRNEGVRGLKFFWLPCQLVSTIAGLVLFIFVALLAEDPGHHVQDVTMYCTECVINFFQNGVLLYCVIRLVMRLRPILSPVSLVSPPSQQHQQQQQPGMVMAAEKL